MPSKRSGREPDTPGRRSRARNPPLSPHPPCKHRAPKAADAQKTASGREKSTEKRPQSSPPSRSDTEARSRFARVSRTAPAIRRTHPLRRDKRMRLALASPPLPDAWRDGRRARARSTRRELEQTRHEVRAARRRQHVSCRLFEQIVRKHKVTRSGCRFSDNVIAEQIVECIENGHLRAAGCRGNFLRACGRLDRQRACYCQCVRTSRANSILYQTSKRRGQIQLKFRVRKLPSLALGPQRRRAHQLFEESFQIERMPARALFEKLQCRGVEVDPGERYCSLHLVVAQTAEMQYCMMRFVKAPVDSCKPFRSRRNDHGVTSLRCDVF